MTRALLAATLLFFAGSAYAADMPLKAPRRRHRLRLGPAGISASTAVADGAPSNRTLQTLGLICFSPVRTSRPWSRARPGASMRRVDWQAGRSATCTSRLRVRPSSAWISPSIGPVSGDPPTAASPLTPLRRPPASAGIWPRNRSHSSPQSGVSAPTWAVVSLRLGRRCLLPSDLQRELHRYLLSIRLKQLVQQGRGRLGRRRRRRVPLCRASAAAW